MMQKLSLLIVLIILAGLTGGCSYESRQTTIHEPGIYKGEKDSDMARQKNQELIDRFKLVQADR